MSDFFLIYIFNNIIFLKTWSWVSGKREEPRIYPLLTATQGKGIQPRPQHSAPEGCRYKPQDQRDKSGRWGTQNLG